MLIQIGMTLVLKDMRMFTKEIGIFDNYKFTTKTNKFINHLVNQFSIIVSL